MSRTFVYAARDPAGRRVRGCVAAPDRSLALAVMQARALIVTSLDEVATVRGSVGALLHVRPVSPGALTAFFRAFSALLGAGISLRRALSVTAEECSDSRLRESLRAIGERVDSGVPLSDAMTERSRDFSALACALVRSAEAAGTLDQALLRLAEISERGLAIRKRLASALAYPCVVACAAVTLLLFLTASIVPVFQSLYAQLHVPLPLTTRCLIAIGSALRDPLALGVFLVMCLGAAWCGLGRRWSRLLRYVPIVSRVVRKHSAAEVTHALGIMLRSGVDLVAALDLAGGIAPAQEHRDGCAAMKGWLQEGCGLTDAFVRSAAFDSIVVQLVRAGEESGALDSMLLAAARYYDADVETALNAAASLFEPAMMLLLGSAILFLVAAIFIPLYSMITAIS